MDSITSDHNPKSVAHVSGVSGVCFTDATSYPGMAFLNTVQRRIRQYARIVH